MRSRLSLVIVLLSGLPAIAQEPKAPAGFVPLFDGKSLAGWHGMDTFDPRALAKMPEADRLAKLQTWTDTIKGHWTAQEGELVNDGQGAFLTTDKEYGDIELMIDYKTVAKADSGVYLRGAPQVQIWDTTESGGKFALGADKGSGGLWNNSPGSPGKDPLVLADNPFGEWNRLRIYQVGARTTVLLNDKLVVDHALMENYFDRKTPILAKGPIQLQTHGGEIRWKNLLVREIPSEEANQFLRSKRGDGFAPIFDGKSLAGWAGPVEQYDVVDGAIRCKPGKGGTIWYDKQYSDFKARVEFKLPPGGNNGLAIRYPGQGDPAYAGMTELQVLDNEAPKYARLDARQYHGSSYGIVAAARGYLRPTGQWNFQEVTVTGSKIKVELNGTVILDADLSTVDKYMANSPHPGKDRTSGFFGLAGHDDPVEFRELSLKSITAKE